MAYDGTATKQVAGDANVRALPDGSWTLFVATGDDPEAKSRRASGIMHSPDRGKTWTPLTPFAIGRGRDGERAGFGPVELIATRGHVSHFWATHAAKWPESWRMWFAGGGRALPSGDTPAPLPGRLGQRTFVRNAITARDGRLMMPFQHYLASDTALMEPRCGVIVSADGGKTWAEHGNIRVGPVHRRFDWEESNVVELDGGRIVMLIRASGLMAMTYRAESTDGGKTWPAAATLLRASALGTASLYSLGGNAVAMIHNPAGRLALWVSLDGMQCWPYQRILTKTTSVGPKEYMSYPHGFVSEDKAWLHFAFVDKMQRAVHYSVKLPGLK